MIKPGANPLALGRMPAAAAADVRAIATAMLRVSVTEDTLASPFQSELTLVNTELARVRSAVEPQQKRIARIEQAVQSIDRRTAVIERTVMEPQGKADAAPSAKVILDTAIRDSPTATETATKPLTEVYQDEGGVPHQGD